MTAVLLDSASWALILSILSPLLISVIQQPKWSKSMRTLVAVLASVVIGIITVLANGGLDLSGGAATQTVLSVVALVFVSSATAYKSLWKPTGVAPAIEARTSGVANLDDYRGKHLADGDKAA